MNVETLSNIIDNFYSKSKTEKVLSLFTEMRSGNYYNSSRIRNYIIGNYKALIINLNEDEYKIVKEEIIKSIPQLILERNQRKIAYSFLSQIIECSCQHADFGVYSEYEKEIIRLAKTNKEKYLYHVITLAQTRRRIFGDISDIEDFFIERFLPLSRIKTINYKYLIDFTMNVDCNRRKFLRYLFKCKPFRNDFVINSFILQHDDLKKLGTLI